jgi:hypothetical protein
MAASANIQNVVLHRIHRSKPSCGRMEFHWALARGGQSSGLRVRYIEFGEPYMQALQSHNILKTIPGRNTNAFTCTERPCMPVASPHQLLCIDHMEAKFYFLPKPDSGQQSVSCIPHGFSVEILLPGGGSHGKDRPHGIESDRFFFTVECLSTCVRRVVACPRCCMGLPDGR